MMMIGRSPHSHPTVQVPPWDFTNDPTVDVHSPFSTTDYGFDALTTSLQRYLPSNANGNANDVVFESDDLDIPVDAFSCDHFRMYDFKVKKCARGRSHDWTECPYAHPGEKARRRDPSKYQYSGTACPEFRKGQCYKGDACEYAHGVFECWLHPARYRTQPCKDGTHCRRRVCFFAHTPDQLRLVPTSPSLSPRSRGGGGPECFDQSTLGFDSFDGSPSRLGFDSFSSKGRQIIYSPTSLSPPYQSPPMSPSAPLSYNSVNGLAESMRGLQIGNKVRMGMSPPSWGGSGSGFSSPRSPSTLRPGLMEYPTTPTRKLSRPGISVFENSCEEEPVMERVESGRGLRARMYAKLSMENSLDSGGSFPDVGWVSELVK